MSIYHLDYETTSACDIGLGAYRYAADQSTRILMFAIAEDDLEPFVWRFDQPNSAESHGARKLLKLAIDSGSLIYAFNVMFEQAISHYRLMQDVGLEPPAIEQWRCVRVMALRAAIPASLAKASEFLKVSDKDKVGKVLINIFSDQSKLTSIHSGKEKNKVPSPILEKEIPWEWEMTVAGQTMTVRLAWQKFIEYCRQDVVVEQQVHHKLSKFELKGMELEGFLFDLRMNHRGAPVNVPALNHAQHLLDEQGDLFTKEFKTLTGLMPSQTAKVLEWLKAQGYPADNLQAKTMDEMLGSALLTSEGKKALALRANLSFAAVKKVAAMLNTVCPDGRMRGLFNFYGAQRTGRWTSSGPQLQNARKPTIKDHDAAYRDICGGTELDLIRDFYGNPYEVVASCIRNFLQMMNGEEMIDLDLANIESRVSSMLAGCTKDLDIYREGRDAYKEMASDIFKISVAEVTKEQRFVAKVAVLSLVFQTGAKTFYETCATWGMPIAKALASKTVRTFRETKPEFPSTWRKFEASAITAIKTPNQWIDANEFVSFARSTKAPFDRLLMRLPSGRCLVYPNPKIERKVKRHKDFDTGEVRDWETDEISFYGALRGYAGWGRVATYAGDLFQSATQATARDIMMHGCILAEKEGFNIFALIHDEALSEYGDVDLFQKCFTTLPEWMPQDFPLAAEGGLVPYYSKD